MYRTKISFKKQEEKQAKDGGIMDFLSLIFKIASVWVPI